MLELNSKWLAAAALATTLVAGCGGGGGGDISGDVQPAPTNPATSASGVVDYLLALIANETSDLSEPKPIDGITFATEELVQPSAI